MIKFNSDVPVFLLFKTFIKCVLYIFYVSIKKYSNFELPNTDISFLPAKNPKQSIQWFRLLHIPPRYQGQPGLKGRPFMIMTPAPPANQKQAPMSHRIIKIDTIELEHPAAFPPPPTTSKKWAFAVTNMPPPYKLIPLFEGSGVQALSNVCL